MDTSFAAIGIGIAHCRRSPGYRGRHGSGFLKLLTIAIKKMQNAMMKKLKTTVKDILFFFGFTFLASAIGSRLAPLEDIQVGEIHFADNPANQRHDEIFYQRSNNLAERGADNPLNSQIRYDFVPPMVPTNIRSSRSSPGPDLQGPTMLHR